MNTMNRRTLLLSVIAAATLAVGPGCNTFPTYEELATPARIQAVVALGAYYGASAAIADGKRAAIEAARDSLTVISASEKVDLPAVVAALQAAGVTYLESQDGILTVGAVLFFSDLWDGSAGKILDEPRIKAVIAGCVRGFSMALDNKKTRGISAVNMNHSALVDDVIATRPARRR